MLSPFRCVCPHLNSGLSLPSCGHPCAQDHKQAEVGEEGDQIPRGNSGGAGGLAAQVRPETPACFIHTNPLELAAGAEPCLHTILLIAFSVSALWVSPLYGGLVCRRFSSPRDLQQQHLSYLVVSWLSDILITTSAARYQEVLVPDSCLDKFTMTQARCFSTQALAEPNGYSNIRPRLDSGLHGCLIFSIKCQLTGSLLHVPIWHMPCTRE